MCKAPLGNRGCEAIGAENLMGVAYPGKIWQVEADGQLPAAHPLTPEGDRCMDLLPNGCQSVISHPFFVLNTERKLVIICMTESRLFSISSLENLMTVNPRSLKTLSRSRSYSFWAW